ncbi:type II secretion system F family protein [Zunongwangia profunda]|jgi:type IV pilus assembly protein PilC|uniref:type II secretion system F family protein n=1 Tax=Zunongwangia profunda TaxID=398743 RepID=UPI000C940ED9|nr:type II secretion system F family protein [Zunongwangia profunda]MAG89071.1 general secretion pathway protein GspF [Flavobacteriaceae bacterium]MCC4230964.1 type II secretion system F family protein [Zunongwangia profunda]|tara:strand:- start:12200 stop:13336 length:1137 start_codon:yes stop_codon:yes gene_type:complete
MGLKVKIDNKTLKNERKSGNGFSDLLQQEISFNGGKWNTKKKEQFFTELSVLLMSGIDLRQSLELLSEENKTKKESSFFKAVYDDVVNGIPFYETLQSSKKFSDYEIETLRVGEATGNLGLVSKDLGEFCKKKNDQRRQITSALTYPVIVILTAFLVVFFMMNYVVPLFKDIFEQNNVELPGITQMILSFSEFLQHNFYGILIVLLLFVVLHFLIRKYHWYKRFIALATLKIPLVGDFIKAIYILRFIQVMKLLANSKISITESLEMSSSLISFYPLKEAINNINKNVVRGAKLSESFREHSIFDTRIITLLKVAEETNQTEFIFEKLYEQYSKELDYKSKQFTNLLNPMLTILIGAIVGVILIAMYLPMFKLSSVIG